MRTSAVDIELTCLVLDKAAENGSMGGEDVSSKVFEHAVGWGKAGQLEMVGDI